MNPIYQKHQILTDISKTSQLMKDFKGEPSKDMKSIYREYLFSHMLTMRLKHFVERSEQMNNYFK